MQSPFDYMKMPLQRYADFSGRSRRMEYWMFFVGIIGASIVASIVDTVLGMNTMIFGIYGPLSIIVTLGTIIPSLACGVRRLHDQNRSGWLMLLPIVPYALGGALMASGNLAMGGPILLVGAVCALVLLVFMFLEGTSGDNKYGPDPKAG
ncbi:MAG: DUF805 domain-containing protein [Chakrabartia sp.]